MGFVSQDVFLFQGTVRENLTYGRPDATDDDVVRAATLAEAHTFISALPDGYDTIVGRAGPEALRRAAPAAHHRPGHPARPCRAGARRGHLSGRQRDRGRHPAVARPRLGRTARTIVIAHRLSTVRHAHRIHVLEAGRVVEAGTHEELVDAGGLYAALWRVQTGETTIEATAAD